MYLGRLHCVTTTWHLGQVLGHLLGHFLGHLLRHLLGPGAQPWEFQPGGRLSGVVEHVLHLNAMSLFPVGPHQVLCGEVPHSGMLLIHVDTEPVTLLYISQDQHVGMY